MSESDELGTEMDLESSEPSTDQSSHAQASQPPASSEQEESEHAAIDMENKESEKEEGRREMAPRSEYWQPFIKMYDSNKMLRAGKYKYCSCEFSSRLCTIRGCEKIGCPAIGCAQSKVVQQQKHQCCIPNL